MLCCFTVTLTEVRSGELRAQKKNDVIRLSATKTIQYDGSESMALDVLEPQCQYLTAYNYDFKAGSKSSEKLNQQQETIKASMRNWCEQVLEENEDEITEGLFRESNELEDWLCEDILGVCGSHLPHGIGDKTVHMQKHPENADL